MKKILLAIIAASGLAYSACPMKPSSVPTSAPPRNTVAEVPAANDEPSSSTDGAAEKNTTAGEQDASTTPAVVSLTPSPQPTGASAAFQLDMLSQLNSRRGGNYCQLDMSLQRAAQDYADLLARTHQQGHFADGDPEYRARRAGFTGSLRQPGKRLGNGETSYGIGEVLAFGHPNIEAAFQGWLDSPGHRSAVMESTFDVCGFGRSGNIYVGLLGNSKVAAAAPPGPVSQPVRAAPQVFSSCGPNGCRRGLFGRR